MDLPLLIPVPPFPVRKAIPNKEWGATLDAWILLTELRLHLSAKELEECAHADGFNAPFLSSYFAAFDDSRLHGSSTAQTIASQKTRQLRRNAFLLIRRYYMDVPSTTEQLFDWRLLGDFSQCYHASPTLKQLLLEIWNRYELKVSDSVEKGKIEIMNQLSENFKPATTSAAGVALEIRRMTILASALPHVGHLLMTGSDYLDALHDSYKLALSMNDDDGKELRIALVANVYIGLTSLLKIPKPNLSLLLDHLFTLKVSSKVGISGKAKMTPELLSDLVCSTDILVRVERYLVSAPQKRGQDLMTSLRGYQQNMKAYHHRHYQRQKRRKNNGEASVDDQNSHAHKLSLVTQIRDLFPDLGDGYVVRLLDYYNDNVETIVAHLLENSLASELEILDKSQPLFDQNIQHDPVKPHHTPPQLTSPQREYKRNIDLEDDEIVKAAQLETSFTGQQGRKKKILFGRSDGDTTADSMLADKSQHAANKAAILSALANFDSDDDERDDTYDMADVGGTVDAALTSGMVDTDGQGKERRGPDSDGTAEDNVKAKTGINLTLYRLWKHNPTQFYRDSATRRSQPRDALKRETGMTDEAIEGWAIMLQRDPHRQFDLEQELAFQAGLGEVGGSGQTDVPSTAYRRPNPKAAVDETDEVESGARSSTSDHANIRGRGRRGRGGNNGSIGPNRGGRGGARGRGANHRRRDQHAKKMAKAGVFPG